MNSFIRLPLLVLALGFLSLPAHAGVIEDLFTDHYHRKYEPRFCGRNALNFVKAIAAERGSAEGFYIVTIENKGFSVFGLVNAEKARGFRFGKPFNEERNWYHHAFVLDAQGNVYDFDFTTEPRIVPIAQYLEEMFLDEGDGKGGAGTFLVGRETKSNDYVLTATTAQAMLSEEANAGNKATLGQVVENWRVLIDGTNFALRECHRYLAAQITAAEFLERFRH